MTIRNGVLGLLALTTAGTVQAATTINFNTPGINGASYTEAGVTFTTIGAGIVSNGYGDTPDGTLGILGRNAANSAFIPLRATFSAAASAVSIDLGDYNSDADDLFLRAYNSGGSLLASATLTIDSLFVGMETLSVSANNIAYVEFGGIGFGGESNVYADNFTFEAASGAVPEPATWAMMIGGFGMVGGSMRYRRRKTSVAYA